ncbi:hypothetical protein BDW22DRAFT_1488247 [Trametopsis cervina]|nr:hypothetical protein BDW22DRAFT_1488247 [Trametopsis cervina]
MVCNSWISFTTRFVGLCLATSHLPPSLMARKRRKDTSPSDSSDEPGTDQSDSSAGHTSTKRSKRARKKTPKQRELDEATLMKEVRKLRRENKAFKSGQKKQATSKISKCANENSTEVDPPTVPSNNVGSDFESEEKDNSNELSDKDNENSDDAQLGPSVHSLGLIPISRPLTTRVGDPKPVRKLPSLHLELPFAIQNQPSSQQHQESLSVMTQPSSPSTAYVSHASSPPPSARSSSPQLELLSEHDNASTHLLQSVASSHSTLSAQVSKQRPQREAILQSHAHVRSASPALSHLSSGSRRSASGIQSSLRLPSGSSSRSISLSSQSPHHLDGQTPNTERQPSSQDEVLVIEFKNDVIPVGIKPREHDYSGTTLAIILRAVKRFEVKLLTVSAFPSHETIHLWTRQSLSESCQEVGKRLPSGSAVERICKLIEARPSTIRGQVKNRVISKIVEVFGMQVDTTKTVNEEANQHRYNHLVSTVGGDGDPNRYCFKDFDAEEPQYLGEHEVLLRALQESCFKSSTDIGIEFRASFDPISLSTIAMLLTMVRFGLDRWATGRLIQNGGKKDFTEKEYKTIYNAHLIHLKDWEDANPPVMQKIRKRMYRKLIRLGNIELEEDTPAGLSASIRQRAVARLADRTGDTDSE